jgi:hypothetical protein
MDKNTTTILDATDERVLEVEPFSCGYVAHLFDANMKEIDNPLRDRFFESLNALSYEARSRGILPADDDQPRDQAPLTGDGNNRDDPGNGANGGAGSEDVRSERVRGEAGDPSPAA